LEINGKKSSGKRTRALNIRYFFMTDQVEKGNVSIEDCPTDNMIDFFHKKPLQGEKFRKLRDEILGCAKVRSHKDSCKDISPVRSNHGLIRKANVPQGTKNGVITRNPG
jgi:hypothetical protein